MRPSHEYVPGLRVRGGAADRSRAKVLPRGDLPPIGPDCVFAQKDPTVMDDLETEHYESNLRRSIETHKNWWPSQPDQLLVSV